MPIVCVTIQAIMKAVHLQGTCSASKVLARSLHKNLNMIKFIKSIKKQLRSEINQWGKHEVPSQKPVEVNGKDPVSLHGFLIRL